MFAMQSSTMRPIAAASLFLFAAFPAAVHAQAMLFIGCYNTDVGMIDKGAYEFQSSGYCQKTCLDSNTTVFAMGKTNTCFCGEELPPMSANVPMSECSSKCPGWPKDMCGGHGTYTYYLVDSSDESLVPTRAASSPGKSTTMSRNTVTAIAGFPTAGEPAATDSGYTSPSALPTPSPSSATSTSSAGLEDISADHKEGSKSGSTAAIAAGVIVGVVGFCALLGAIFFFLRFKTRRVLNTGKAGYYNKPAEGSPSSRFDGNLMAERRQSNGSIEDGKDFSRRILQVTNPDR